MTLIFFRGIFSVCVSVRLFKDYHHCSWTDLDETSFRIEYRCVDVSPKVWDLENTSTLAATSVGEATPKKF